MTTEREFRAFAPLEFRADGDGGVKVAGYAAVFNQETRISDMWIERLSPGAFTNTLSVRGIKGAVDDVTFLINHNRNFLLARSRSGTLNLTEDEKGLFIESVLDPVDPDAVRVVQKMKRGDLASMSFGFRAVRQLWQERPDMLPLRTIQEVELFDVSVVTEPAYAGTDISLRSAHEAIRDANLPRNDVSAKAALSRLRMKHGLFSRGLSA